MKTKHLLHLLASALVFAGFTAQLSAQTQEVDTRLRQGTSGIAVTVPPPLDRTLTQGAGPLSDSETIAPGVAGTALASFGYLETSINIVSPLGFEGGVYYNGSGQSDADFTETLTITSPTIPNGTAGSLLAHWAVTGHIAESVNSGGLGRALVGWSMSLGDFGTNESYDSLEDVNTSEDHTVSFSTPSMMVTGFTFGQPFTFTGHLTVSGGTAITGGGFEGMASSDVTFQWLGSSILDNSSQPVNDAMYNSGSGTDYTMPVSAPEPSTWVTLAGGLAMLCARRRTRLA